MSTSKSAPIRFTQSNRRWHDAIATVVVWMAAALVLAIFCWIMFDLIRHGFQQLSLDFLWQSPSDAGRAGGIFPILISTGLILCVCMVTALPIGIGAAIFLAEFSNNQHRTGRLVRRCLDALAAVPSIVFGLFGNALFCVMLGMGFSILSGGLTLACMVLPLFIRSAEEGLRSVPDDYRHAAAALGMSRTTTLFRILLPAATPALIVGFVLAVSRALAETAALIFTSGYVDRTPESLFDSGRAISVHIYDLALNVPGGDQNAYAAALMLVLVLLAINTVAALVGRYFQSKHVSP